MGITEKQQKILIQAGWTEKDIAEKPYQVLSDAIGKILAERKPNQFHKEVKGPQVENVEVQGWKGNQSKPNKFDATSSYTRQATDILIALIENQAEKEQPVDIGTLMSQAIQCVLAAKRTFE